MGIRLLAIQMLGLVKLRLHFRFGLKQSMGVNAWLRYLKIVVRIVITLSGWF
jgi:hypothetical protein